MKLSSKTASRTHRTLVYGPPKVGKTELVGSLSSKFKLIWFDLERGSNTLLKLPVNQQEQIELIEIPDSKVYPIAVETMLKVMSGAKVSICERHGKVACPICRKDNLPVVDFCLSEVPDDTIVVVDSLTQFSNSAIANITKNQPDDYKMDFSDWGNLRALVEKLLSCVQAANCNIVCITHEEEVTMEDGRSKIVPVCGSSKSSRNTAKYFDHVIYCEVKNKKHVAASITTYANNVVTGSRTDVDLEKSVNGLLAIYTNQSPPPALQTQGEKALTALQKLSLNREKGIVK